MRKSLHLTLPKTPSQTQGLVEHFERLLTADIRCEAEILQYGLIAELRCDAIERLLQAVSKPSASKDSCSPVGFRWQQVRVSPSPTDDELNENQQPKKSKVIKDPQ